MIRSILFIPTHLPDYQRWLESCGFYCASRGYQVVCVVSAWSDLLRMLATGQAEVAVAARPDHFGDGLEFVSEQGPADEQPSRRQVVRLRRSEA